MICPIDFFMIIYIFKNWLKFDENKIRKINIKMRLLHYKNRLYNSLLKEGKNINLLIKKKYINIFS